MTVASQHALSELADTLGIIPSYTDVFGNPHHLSDATREALVRAMGIAPDKAADALQNFYDWPKTHRLEPVYVLSEQELHQAVCFIPANLLGETMRWTLQLETGPLFEGAVCPQDLPDWGWACEGVSKRQLNCLPQELPQGYHRLQIVFNETDTTCARFIVTPTQCYLPDSLRNGHKSWGPAVQLYSLRSDENWGMGDYKDLEAVIDWCKAQGANTIGVNPLHQLFPNNVHHISPYSPSSQAAFNVWYLRPEAMSNYPEATDAQAMVDAPAFQAQLAQFRATELVDTNGVLSAKMTVFKALYAHFVAAHMAKQTPLAKSFQAFCEAAAQPVHQLALFEALQAHFQEQDSSVYGWPKWPVEYHNPYGEAVRRFATEQREAVEFYLYLQWQAELQLGAVTQKAKAAGLDIGLYLDLSVGVDCSGAQVWANQGLYATDIRVGCPPDLLNQKGQDWGLPPLIPHKLREEGYELLIQMLRENMHYAGALRLDHAMGLYRLFWIPAALGAAEGAYIRQPFMDFVKIIALESHRNQCVVIGEDLGTVVPEVRDTMAEWLMLSYKVLYFEKDAPDVFTPAEDYNPVALVTSGTHDLPTLKGFWDEGDIAIRTELNLYPNDEMRTLQLQEREVDKRSLLDMLQHEGYLKAEDANFSELTPAIVAAIQAFLAASPSCLQLVQVEDLLCQYEQMNVPGTTTEHPNWRQKLSVKTADWHKQSSIETVLQTVKSRRNG